MRVELTLIRSYAARDQAKLDSQQLSWKFEHLQVGESG